MALNAANGGRTGVVLALGITQTISWAASYYVPAVLAVPMARDLGLPNAWVFGAFSAALLVMALLGPAVGRQIDVHGGRRVLLLSHIVLAGGLALLALAQGPVTMILAWLVLGIGMTMGLYDAAFAALAGFYGSDARRPITGITLIAGFASTIGWPIHAMLEQAYSWRTACLVWAIVHVVICIPMCFFALPRHAAATVPGPAGANHVKTTPDPPPLDTVGRRNMWLVALMFSCAWFVTGAMATHLLRLLEAFGTSTNSAIAAAALVGPAQVAARLVEFTVFSRIHPITSAQIATVLHPVGAALLYVLGAPAAAAFVILYGAGNGILTIARGTLPLALFGPAGYGLRQGLISAPARLTQATAPFLFALVLNASATWALILSSALLLISFAVLLLLGRPRD